MLLSKISDGIWIGNSEISENVFAALSITAIIKLSKIKTIVADVDYFEFVVPSDELMENEYAGMISKLETICNVIAELRDNGHSVLIQSEDGRNKSAIVAGYYIVRRCKINADDAIAKLSYDTPALTNLSFKKILKK